VAREFHPYKQAQTATTYPTYPRGIDLSEPHLDSARQVSLDLDPAGYGEGSVSDLVHWFIHRRFGVADCRVLHSHVTELAVSWGYLFVPVRYQVFIRNRELPKHLY
jgi:hypothetical protein